MKKFVITLLAVALVSVSDAQLRTPAPSPPQTIKQDFGLASIELSYSRPGIKGRKIFGDLVPNPSASFKRPSSVATRLSASGARASSG